MIIFDTLQTALVQLGANKLRTSLTMLGIVIGVGAVIALMAAGQGAQQGVTKEVSALGDLYVVVGVREHPLFTRDGADLLCEVPVSFAQAALGTEIEVPTLSGKRKLTIPPGTQSGQEFVLKNEGIAVLNSHRRGNLLVRVLIEVPKKLTRRQKELLTELQELSAESPGPISRTFFEKVRELFG